MQSKLLFGLLVLSVFIQEPASAITIINYDQNLTHLLIMDENNCSTVYREEGEVCSHGCIVEWKQKGDFRPRKVCLKMSSYVSSWNYSYLQSVNNDGCTVSVNTDYRNRVTFRPGSGC